MFDSVELKKLLYADREAAFFRLRGGYPIPLAGATWWAMLGTMGYFVHNPNAWIILTFYSSGLLFPLALLYARIFKIDFMHDKSAALDVLVPTFVSMLLFWPVAIAAFWSYPPLPDHCLLCALELVAIDTLHPASLHGCSGLSADCSCNSYLLVSTKAEDEFPIRRSDTFVRL